MLLVWFKFTPSNETSFVQRHLNPLAACRPNIQSLKVDMKNACRPNILSLLNTIFRTKSCGLYRHYKHEQSIKKENGVPSPFRNHFYKCVACRLVVSYSIRQDIFMRNSVLCHETKWKQQVCLMKPWIAVCIIPSVRMCQTWNMLIIDNLKSLMTEMSNIDNLESGCDEKEVGIIVRIRMIFFHYFCCCFFQFFFKYTISCFVFNVGVFA